MVELYPFQKEDIVTIENFDGRVLNANDPGLGKTIETLCALKRNEAWLPSLVVCPAAVKYQWVFEARRHFGISASVCESKSPPKYNRHDFSIRSILTIINYDILKDWIPYLKNLGLRSIIFDEGQYLVNQRAIRTKAARHIARWVDHVMVLSGTPFTNRLSELWSVLNLLWPEHFPAFTAFAQVYCKPRWTPWGWDYSRSCNTEELHARLIELGMIRRRKVDVLKDLPEKIRQVVPCELTDRSEYESANRDFMGWIKKTMPHKARAAARAESLAKVGYIIRLTARLKMKSVVEWVNRYLEDTDEKITLFAIHERAIDVLRRRVNSKSVVIDGSVSSRNRQIAIEQFHKDDDIRVFIGNIHAAGIGTNLTASSTSGICELYWRPGDHLQVEDRIHRIGQTKKTWINYLIAGDTIEERLCQILQEKQQVLSSVLDGGPTSEDLNIFEILMDELRKEQ